MSDSAVEVTRDHHGVEIVMPVHREPGRRWWALGLGVAVIALTPLPVSVMAVLVGAALWARDRRRSVLRLSHDTLTVESTRFGVPTAFSVPWDRVEAEASREAPWVLTLRLDGREHRIAWAGTREDLTSTLDALAEAQAAYRPDAGRIAPAPEALERLRGHEV